MPDLMAHVLLAYSVGMILSWRYQWVDSRYLTVMMVGALVPDLAKADILLDSDLLGYAIGIAFDWFALHTLGGVLLSILIGCLLVVRTERKRVFLLLSIGASSHLLTDALLITPSGLAYPIFWPIAYNQPPSAGLYLSTDVWPAVVAGLLAIAVTAISRMRDEDTEVIEFNHD